MKGVKYATDEERLVAKRANSLRTYYKTQRNAECRRAKKNYDLVRNYGITLEAYEKLHAAQGGRYAICFKVKKLHVDHCHKSKKVRGLLCLGCNTAIGKMGEDPELLKRAAIYCS